MAALVIGGGGGFAIGHQTSNNSASPKAKATPTRTKPKAKATHSQASTIDVFGTLELQGADSWETADDGTCNGSSGYDDLAEGAEVIIADDADRTLKITTLEIGSITSGDCDFNFSATIPAGLHYYGISVTHRGTVKFKESEMYAPDLTIGS